MWWKNSWIANREVLKQKVSEDYATLMDNEELKELIRDFARRDRDGKFKLLKFK